MHNYLEQPSTLIMSPLLVRWIRIQSEVTINELFVNFTHCEKKASLTYIDERI